MKKYQLGEMEGRFADIIWKNEPIKSGELTKICEKELDWKRTTTYTMLKRLCDRGIFQNEKGTVSSLMSKEELGVSLGEEFLEVAFDGSLPQFLTAFTHRNRLSKKEIAEIQKLIDDHKEG